MSHSDPCGRCRQPRRAHIDTVAGLLCPAMRFVQAEPAPESERCQFCGGTGRLYGGDRCDACEGWVKATRSTPEDR